MFADSVATTLAISWATEAFGLSAGIVITASHNPPEYNGFKIKANFGGPATPEMISAVEVLIDGAYPSDLAPFDVLSQSGSITL